MWSGRRTTVFRFGLVRLFGADPGCASIWSGRSAAFGFVRDLPEGLTAKIDDGVGGAAGFAVSLCFAGVWDWGGG